MRRKLFSLLALATVTLLVLGGCSSNRDSDSISAAADTPEEILRATSYVGADRCGSCHETLHAGWEASAHTKKLRDGSLESNYMNDADISGRSDYFDGTPVDLGTFTSDAQPDGTPFAVYGVDAPILGVTGTGAYIEIGGVQYDITYTLGGTGHDEDEDGLVLNEEGKWKQRYITTVGKSNYILPVQFNAKTQKYNVYHGEDWYDENNLPLAERIKNQSYERRCAGCHVTGLEVALDGDEWTMEFSDISVACEACHGPGGQHSAAPTKMNIINPATLVAIEDLNGDDAVDTLDTLLVRNYVCYACHTRGSGMASEAAGTSLGYPSKAGPKGEVQLYIPGLDWKEYYTVSTKDSDYWGGNPSTGFITSKSHHQQQQDLDNGPHAVDKPYDHECFACHDMHSVVNDSMVASTMVEDGIEIPVDSNNDSRLCLSCHSGHGDFADLTVLDVRNDPVAVAEAIADHMAAQAYMTSGDAECADCHMPKTAKSSADWVKDVNDMVTEGDVTGHTLRIVWPSLSTSNPGMPNSCSKCHNAGGPLIDVSVAAGTENILAWSNSGHGDETARAWTAYDWDGDEERRECQECHTATGARNFLTDPENYDAEDNEFSLREGENQVLYCYGCHAADTDSGLHEPGAMPRPYSVGGVQVVLPDLGNANVCVNCHGARGNMETYELAEVPATDMSALKPGFGPGTKNVTEAHYLVAAATLYSEDTRIGYEYAEQDYANMVFFAHDGIGIETGSGPCVRCHLETDENSHLFMVVDKDDMGVITAIRTQATCNDTIGCHGGSMDAATLEDEAEGYHEALEILEAALASNGLTFTGSYPYFSGDSWINEGVFGAAHNFNYLHHEPGGYAHNRFYVKRLIFDSIDWLDNGVLDDTITIDAVTYPEAAVWFGADEVTGDATRPGDPAPGPGPVDGAALFVTNCGLCHTGNGAGSGGVADLTAMGAAVITKINDGHQGITLTPEELQAIADFLDAP